MQQQTLQETKRIAPGPRQWPLLGNLGVASGMLAFLERQWASHGDVFRLRMPGFQGLALAHPDALQRVLVSNRHNYVKGPAYDVPRRIFGDGLITLEGERWKQQRSLAQPAFHRASLEKLTATMVESGARFFDALAGKLDEPRVIDVQTQMVRLTLDVVMSALFGRDLLDEGEISYEALSASLEVLSEGANGLPLPSWVPTPHNLKYHRTRKALDANVHAIVRAARTREHDGTLLSMLLATRDEHGAPLSDSTLRDEVVTLFIAGHETTALTLTWWFAMLDGQPEILARLRDEVDHVLGGREPTFADFPKLPYLRQVIDETLRLRPPAPMVVRDVVADDELQGYHVPAGSAVLPLFWLVHRHPDFWPEPLRFDPERFAPGAGKGRHPACYLPFSIGPRVCIGNMFSLLETTLLTAQILQRFELQIGSCAEVQPVAIGTVRPSRPVLVRFARRDR